MAVMKLSESGTCDITNRNLVEYNLDVNADKMLFYFLATACKCTAFDIVSNVPGGRGSQAWIQLFRRCVNPPQGKQLSEALGLFVGPRR